MPFLHLEEALTLHKSKVNEVSQFACHAISRKNRKGKFPQRNRANLGLDWPQVGKGNFLRKRLACLFPKSDLYAFIGSFSQTPPPYSVLQNMRESEQPAKLMRVPKGRLSLVFLVMMMYKSGLWVA